MSTTYYVCLSGHVGYEDRDLGELLACSTCGAKVPTNRSRVFASREAAESFHRREEFAEAAEDAAQEARIARARRGETAEELAERERLEALAAAAEEQVAESLAKAAKHPSVYDESWAIKATGVVEHLGVTYDIASEADAELVALAWLARGRARQALHDALVAIQAEAEHLIGVLERSDTLPPSGINLTSHAGAVAWRGGLLLATTDAQHDMVETLLNAGRLVAR